MDIEHFLKVRINAAMMDDAIVCSAKSREECAARLRKLGERMCRNREMFAKQPEVAACLNMICALAQELERILENA